MLVTGKLVNSVSNNFAKIIVSPFKFFAPNLSELTCMQAFLSLLGVSTQVATALLVTTNLSESSVTCQECIATPFVR